jgi:hypothetical protein
MLNDVSHNNGIKTLRGKRSILQGSQMNVESGLPGNLDGVWAQFYTTDREAQVSQWVHQVTGRRPDLKNLCARHKAAGNLTGGTPPQGFFQLRNNPLSAIKGGVVIGIKVAERGCIRARIHINKSASCTTNHRKLAGDSMQQVLADKELFGFAGVAQSAGDLDKFHDVQKSVEVEFRNK